MRATAVTKQFLANMPVLWPAESVTDAFETIVRPNDELVMSLERDARKLAQLRDYLLPRLLFGAIRVREAEWAVGFGGPSSQSACLSGKMREQ